MTSSLVGSEMCIRDSSTACGPAASHTPRLSAPRPITVMDKLAGLLSSSPVSYTHLTLPTICSV
eukprot:6870837-Prorocentrum_lima.AAC.1